MPHGDNHHLWIHPENPDILINSNDGGANISGNGGKTWSTQQNQPTAQFYRVNTDNQFPYWVYGGQQDNTSVAIASQTFDYGITWKDWHPVGGCESAYVAFDPDNPAKIYAGCYMGLSQRMGRPHAPGAQRHGLPDASGGDGLARHEVPLQLERAHRCLAPRSESHLPRGERSPAVEPTGA